MIFDSLDQAVGAVISETPYVELLSVPKFVVYAPVGGFSSEWWEALANVQGMLALVQVRVYEVQG